MTANPARAEPSAAKQEVFHSLTGLRFVLAIWIAIYHLALLYGPQGMASSPLISLGNARVDGFFLLSGFVLSHIYAVRTGGKFAFGPFLQARIARLYPLHLFALGMLLAAVLAAYVLGQGGEVKDYTPLGFVANVLMLQAWNVPGAGYWNFPAWTLSAEFFAYLCFPLIVFCMSRLARRGFLLLAVALVLVALVEALWTGAGHKRLTTLTQSFGVLRGLCGVIIGVAARYAFEKIQWSTLQATAAAVVGAGLAGLAAVEHAPLYILHAGGVLVVLGLASMDRAGTGTILSGKTMRRLGDISYALFILHVPTFILATRALAILGWNGVLDLPIALVMLGLALALAVIVNRVFEVPARAWIRGLTLFKPQAAGDQIKSR